MNTRNRKTGRLARMIGGQCIPDSRWQLLFLAISYPMILMKSYLFLCMTHDCADGWKCLARADPASIRLGKHVTRHARTDEQLLTC